MVKARGNNIALNVDKEGCFVTELKDPGEYILTLSPNGFSPVEQKFSFEGKSENMTLKPNPKYWAAEVSFNRQRGKGSDGNWSSINFAITVSLCPRSEVVMVSGYDFTLKRINYELYCNSRIDDLYGRQMIDEGTIVTYFNFDEGKKKTLRRTHSGKWVVINEKLQGDGGPITVEYEVDLSYHSLRKTISITHVYDYIKEVGANYPGTIKELSIFSHSWREGPILINSEEGDDGLGVSYKTSDLRDPNDHDARLKDFNNTNMPDLENFNRAFHGEGVFRVWGCNSEKRFLRIIRRLETAKSDNEHISSTEVELEKEIWGYLTRKNASEYFKRVIRDFMYCAFAAKAIRAKVYGGLPGIGALLRQDTKTKAQYMYVDKIAYKRFLQFYERNLGIEIDEYGYALYDPQRFQAPTEKSILDAESGRSIGEYPIKLSVSPVLVQELRELREDMISPSGYHIERSGIISKAGELLPLSKDELFEIMSERAAEESGPRPEIVAKIIGAREKDRVDYKPNIAVHTHPGPEIPSYADIGIAVDECETGVPSKELVVGRRTMYLMIPTMETLDLRERYALRNHNLAKRFEERGLELQEYFRGQPSAKNEDFFSEKPSLALMAEGKLVVYKYSEQNSKFVQIIFKSLNQ